MAEVKITFKNGKTNGNKAANIIAAQLGIKLELDGFSPSGLWYRYKLGRGWRKFKIVEDATEKDVKKIITQLKGIKRIQKEFEDKIEIKTFEI